MADRSARTSFSDAVNSNTRHDALRHAWMKANYLIAAGIAMASWLFLIAWIVSRIL
jgi:lambda repressor-like predicted transcriptional regulator